MRLESFWPPRRTRDRIAAEYYRRRNIRAPWLTRDAIELLPDLLRSTDRCLEWGSGGSTSWLSPRVHSICSVEHDLGWYERVRGELAAAGLDSRAVRLESLEPNDAPGESPYVRVIDEFDPGELDICLIDGEHRAACARAAVPKLASGGVLILDDAHTFLDHPSSSPGSRPGLGPLDQEWAGFVADVRDWRLIWTTDGYSDTAIWIKP